MLTIGSEEVTGLFIGDKPLMSAFIGEAEAWGAGVESDMWTNTTITRLFLNNSGSEVSNTNGDWYESINRSVESGKRYRFAWDSSVAGADGVHPTIRVCFFDKYGIFIQPRQTYISPESGKGSFTVVAPTSATSIDVRIDDASSRRGQHFVGFKMYKL